MVCFGSRNLDRKAPNLTLDRYYFTNAITTIPQASADATTFRLRLCDDQMSLLELVQLFIESKLLMSSSAFSCENSRVDAPSSSYYRGPQLLVLRSTASHLNFIHLLDYFIAPFDPLQDHQLESSLISQLS